MSNGEREIISHDYDGGVQLPGDILPWWDDVWRDVGEFLEETGHVEDGTRIKTLTLSMEAGEPTRIETLTEIGDVKEAADDA